MLTKTLRQAREQDVDIPNANQKGQFKKQISEGRKGKPQKRKYGRNKSDTQPDKILARLMLLKNLYQENKDKSEAEPSPSSG